MKMIPQKNFNESKKKKKNENHTTDDRREENKVSIENPVPYSVVAFLEKCKLDLIVHFVFRMGNMAVKCVRSSLSILYE